MPGIAIFLIIIVAITPKVHSQESFYISFQSQSSSANSASPKQWVEFENSFRDSKELTNCQWIRIKYFNIDVEAQLWSYCELQSQNDTMRCLQLWLEDSPKSVNRDLIMHFGISINGINTTIEETVVDLDNLLHRTWISLCLTISTIESKINFYYNGNLMGAFDGLLQPNENIIKDSTTIFDSALIFGQEPDEMRGGFDPFQAFIGDLAEFHLWNYVLSEKEILDIAQCNNFKQGNVVAWDREKIRIQNALTHNIHDEKLCCKEQKRFVIFPNKENFLGAKRTCMMHGGRLAIPKSQIVVRNLKLLSNFRVVKYSEIFDF